MNLRQTLLLPLLLCILFIGSLNAQEPAQGVAQASPASSLEGVWIAERILSAGEEVPKSKFPFELHFTTNQLIYKFVGNVQGKDRVHDIRLDLTATPATLDITRAEDEKKLTVKAIVKHDGDQLQICFSRGPNSNPSETRPTTFESTAAAKTDLLILKRKPAPDK